MAIATLASSCSAGAIRTGSTSRGASALGAGPACARPAQLTSTDASSTTGITRNSITVGNVSILSGPVPGLFQGAPYGVQAYFAFVNAHGGVFGRKLYLHSYDDGFSGPQNQQETQQAVNSDFALVGSFSLFDNYGCKVLAQNPAMPDVSVTLDPSTNALPNDFSAQPLANGLPLGPYQFLKSLYPRAITSVANLVADTATALNQWQGQRKAMEHLGYRFTYVRQVSPLETNFTGDVINMRNKGVKALYLTDLDWQDAAAIVQAMVQQNWHPQLVFSAGPIYADQFIKTAGGASATDGIWLGQGQSLYLGQDRSAIPAVNTFLSWVQKTHPGFTPDLFTLYGWASAQLFVQALRAAGPHPTRASVLTQLSKIDHFSASNLMAPSNPARKLPPSCYLLARIVNGKFTRVADPSNGGYRCDAPYYYADSGATESVPES